MNRKQKKELRQRQSTRQLMGIVRVTPHGVMTDSGERVFFLIQPDNLSVLSPEVIRGRVRSLTMLLSTQPSLEIWRWTPVSPSSGTRSITCGGWRRKRSLPCESC